MAFLGRPGITPDHQEQQKSQSHDPGPEADEHENPDKQNGATDKHLNDIRRTDLKPLQCFQNDFRSVRQLPRGENSGEGSGYQAQEKQTQVM